MVPRSPLNTQASLLGAQVQQEQSEVKALEQQLAGWKSSMTELQLAAAIKQGREQASGNGCG